MTVVRIPLMLPVLCVLARAWQVGALLVAASLAGLTASAGIPIPLAHGLAVMTIAALGVMAVGLALALPYLPDVPPSEGSTRMTNEAPRVHLRDRRIRKAQELTGATFCKGCDRPFGPSRPRAGSTDRCQPCTRTT